MPYIGPATVMNDPMGSLLKLLLFRGRHHHYHLAAFHLRTLFHDSQIFQILFHPLQHFKTQLTVGVLPATKPHGYLGLVSIFKKACQITQLDLVVPNIGHWAKLDFLDLYLFLFLLGGLLLLLFLKNKLAKIHHPAYGGFSMWHDLHQIQTRILGSFHRLFERDDPDLFTIGANQSYIRRCDFVIQSVLFVLFGDNRYLYKFS